LPDIQAWYNQQLLASGWSRFQDDFWCPGNLTVILAYVRGDQLAMIAGKTINDRTIVMIVVQPRATAEAEVLHTIGFLCLAQ